MSARRALSVAALGLSTLDACSRRTSTVAPELPQLELDALQFDFGAARTHDELSHAFRAHNAGRSSLQITSIEAAHECRVDAGALTVPPGKSAELHVQCRPEQHGAFLGTVVVNSNDPRTPRIVLELLARVTPLLAWDRPLLIFNLPFGQERKETLTLIGARAGEAHISLVEPVDPALTVELGHPAASDALSVTCRGAAVGMRSGELRVRTGLVDPSELSLPFSCQVTGTLELDPSNPYFDLLSTRGQKLEITVKSAQPAFRVLAADVLDGPFRASLSGVPGGAYRVTLTYLPAQATPDARGVLGHLRLRSTDRSEPEKTVDLFAFGRAAPTASQ
ncbi:MAG TPA: DUF1573 domain-containing protein [Polyangiaceae bacterium]